MQGTDESLLSKFQQLNEKNAALRRSGKANHFVVVHYAGGVQYNIMGFLEKNKDTYSTFLFSLFFFFLAALMERNQQTDS
jgi:myosin heavy subunit